jgi:hypothetical protein
VGNPRAKTPANVQAVAILAVDPALVPYSNRW